MMQFLKRIGNYKGEVNFAISNVVTSCVSMATGIIAAAFVDPEELGVIQTVLLIYTYASFLHLGVFSGLNRNLAYYKAKGDIDTMQDEINTSYKVSYVVAFVSGVIGIIAFIYYFLNGYDTIYLISSILLVASLILTPLITNIEATYKSGQEFGRLGNKKNIQSIVYLVFSFLPAFIGALGRIVAGVINLIVGYILRLINPPYKCTGRGSFKSLKDLFYTGFPILISSYIWSIINVMDKTYIASTMSSKEVGLYTIAGYCVTLFMMIPSSISALLYPKAAAIYGSTGRKEALIGFWSKSILLMVAVLVPVAVAAYFLLPPVVSCIMPKYTDGIKVAQITLLTCTTFIYFGPSALFGTLKKNSLYIVFQLFLLGLFWFVVTVFRKHFNTLEDVAWFRFVLSLIQMFFVIIYTRLMLIEKK